METAEIDDEECADLVRLLSIPHGLRQSEDVFEIANSLFRASFVRQLDVTTRCVVEMKEPFPVEEAKGQHGYRAGIRHALGMQGTKFDRA